MVSPLTAKGGKEGGKEGERGLGLDTIPDKC